MEIAIKEFETVTGWSVGDRGIRKGVIDSGDVITGPGGALVPYTAAVDYYSAAKLSGGQTVANVLRYKPCYDRFDVRRFAEGPIAEELFLRLGCLGNSGVVPGTRLIKVSGKHGCLHVARFETFDPKLGVVRPRYAAVLMADSGELKAGVLRFKLDLPDSKAKEVIDRNSLLGDIPAEATNNNRAFRYGNEPTTIHDKDTEFVGMTATWTQEPGEVYLTVPISTVVEQKIDVHISNTVTVASAQSGSGLFDLIGKVLDLFV